MLRVRLADPASLDAAWAVLADLGSGEQSEADRDRASGELRLAVANAAASAEAIRRLDAEQLPILAIEVQEPSLDDVFLSLTGRPAEADPTATAELEQEAA